MFAERNTTEFLKSIIDNVPYGLLSTDTHGKVTLVNQQILGYINKKGTPADFLGIDLFDFFSSFTDTIKGKIKQYIDDNQNSFYIKGVDFFGKSLNLQGRNFREGMIISIFDVTEALRSRNQDTLTLIRGEEICRRKLYKELHDGLGALISTVNLKLDVVKTELDEIEHKTITEVDSIQKLMQTATNDLRSISQTLIPSALIDFGLSTALIDLCKSISKTTSVDAHFYESGLEERLDINLELGMFRIVQEVVSNTLNHGNAKSIHIQLTKHDNYVSLIIEDDGVGFDKNQMIEILQKGVGIRNIRTRTRSFNGTFHIDTNIGKGVVTSLEFPINKK